MSEHRINLSWAPPGPVAAAFMADRSPVSGINGPVGSGKTTAAIMKAVRLGQAQAPSTGVFEAGPGGGAPWPVRRFKLCIVRDTYRQLSRSTIPSWQSRFPKTLGTWNGAENAPASHRIQFYLPDRTMLDLQVDFVAIGDQSVEEVLRGYEVTAFYLNELDMMSQEVFTYAIGRTGRFPPMSEGGPSWHGILYDCNAPELDSWLYEDFFLATPAELRARGISLFRQPGGMDPKAENLPNLPGGREYYERQVAANSNNPGYSTRMVHNKPGFSRSGMPVYGEFNDLLHVRADDHPGVPPLRLVVGLDAGMQPAALFMQRLPSGKVLWLSELCAEPGTGPRRFGEMLAQKLRERFPDWTGGIVGCCDPSALYGADKKAGEQDWSQIVAAQAGIRIYPAPTNNPIPRWEAVRRPLTMLIDGEPAFQLNPECRVVRAGFNSGYRFRRIAGTAARFNTEQAEKTAPSHVHDAGQYANSYAGEDSEIRTRRGVDAAQAARLPAQSPEWDPYASVGG
ncbi:MAG: hypothetical protein ACKVQR_04465 [Aquabacterium sp.]